MSEVEGAYNGMMEMQVRDTKRWTRLGLAPLSHWVAEGEGGEISRPATTIPLPLPSTPLHPFLNFLSQGLTVKGS